MRTPHILGIRIDDTSLEKAKVILLRMLNKKQKQMIFTPNPEICLKGYRNKSYRRVLNKSHLNIPDGFGLKIGAFIFGTRLKNRVTGVALSKELLKIATTEHKRVLFLGSYKVVGDKALKNIKAALPSLEVSHLEGGKFSKTGEPEDTTLISRINNIHPDIIFVCLGAPKQEHFIVNNIKQLNCSLMLGVGGVLDFLSGNIKRAPKWMRKSGFEWLYRLLKEPVRFRRILNALIVFPYRCIIWKLGNIFTYRRNVVGLVINNEGKILLCKRNPRQGDTNNEDVWQIPQGGMKKDETYEQAIQREMLDEIGTNNFDIQKIVPNAYKYKWPKNAQNIDRFKGQKQTICILKYKGKNEDISVNPHEFVDYAWVPQSDVLERAHPIRRGIIEIGLKNLEK